MVHGKYNELRNQLSHRESLRFRNSSRWQKKDWPVELHRADRAANNLRQGVRPSFPVGRSDLLHNFAKLCNDFWIISPMLQFFRHNCQRDFGRFAISDYRKMTQ
jgi:hypothetical protein